MVYPTIESIIAANVARGGHWFGKEEMSFFNTQIHPVVFHGNMFITSEGYEPPWYSEMSIERKFSIRMCDPQGKIHTIGEHGCYATLQQAIEAIQGMPDIDTVDEDGCLDDGAQ